MKTSSLSKIEDLKRRNMGSAKCARRRATIRSEKWCNGQGLLHHEYEYVYVPSAGVSAHKEHVLFRTLHTSQAYTSFQTFKLVPSEARRYRNQIKFAEYTRRYQDPNHMAYADISDVNGRSLDSMCYPQWKYSNVANLE
jgi:hypothetical protein